MDEWGGVWGCPWGEEGGDVALKWIGGLPVLGRHREVVVLCCVVSEVGFGGRSVAPWMSDPWMSGEKWGEMWS